MFWGLMVAACNPLGLQDREQPDPTGIPALALADPASVYDEIYNSSRTFVSAVSTHTAIRNAYGAFHLTYTTFVSI